MYVTVVLFPHWITKIAKKNLEAHDVTKINYRVVTNLKEELAYKRRVDPKISTGRAAVLNLKWWLHIYA